MKSGHRWRRLSWSEKSRIEASVLKSELSKTEADDQLGTIASEVIE
jgi:hypothetical protein